MRRLCLYVSLFYEFTQLLWLYQLHDFEMSPSLMDIYIHILKKLPINFILNLLSIQHKSLPYIHDVNNNYMWFTITCIKVIIKMYVSFNSNYCYYEVKKLIHVCTYNIWYQYLMASRLYYWIIVHSFRKPDIFKSFTRTTYRT